MLSVVAAVMCAATAWIDPACSVEIVLNDVAADRVERQRHFVRNELPLPGTPRLSDLDQRLKERGLARGRPIYIRIFKAESELELWMQNEQGSFGKLATYPICHWTGTLGPKLKEGDKQSPEGFYSVGWPQTRLVGRWRRAFNLGFPNQHDQALNRTGSYILIHGGCSSVGCFAMTDPVQEEIYGLADAALAAGQKRFQVHIFPFRMTAENLSRYADSEWVHTWADLKPAYDSFERTHIPPAIALCGPRYKIADGLPGETGSPEVRLVGLKPLPAEGAARDMSVVFDSAGRWLQPACDFDDEARRKPTQVTDLPVALDRVAVPAIASHHASATMPANSVVLSSAPGEQGAEAATAASEAAMHLDAVGSANARTRHLTRSSQPARRATRASVAGKPDATSAMDRAPSRFQGPGG